MPKFMLMAGIHSDRNAKLVSRREIDGVMFPGLALPPAFE